LSASEPAAPPQVRPPGRSDIVRVLHVSDLHFGVYSIAEQVDAIENMITVGDFDVVAVSGDLTQRARRHEFARARRFLAHADACARTIAVPGNHDVAWWRAPMHIGFSSLMYRKWRRFLGRQVEPVLHARNAVFAGVNTAHGISRHTLTRRPRDLSVIGDLRDRQIARVRRVFEEASASFRIVVMHHNPVAGEISGRYGLKHSAHVLEAFAAMRTDLLLCGHDHQEAVHFVELTQGSVVVSIAGTLTTRSRRGRPGSVNVIELDPARIRVHTMIWDPARRAFVPGPDAAFGRAARA
jgi:3',5'-cyclic AMP phosphodiesterase CpdA